MQSIFFENFVWPTKQSESFIIIQSQATPYQLLAYYWQFSPLSYSLYIPASRSYDEKRKLSRKFLLTIRRFMHTKLIMDNLKHSERPFLCIFFSLLLFVNRRAVPENVLENFLIVASHHPRGFDEYFYFIASCCG